MEFCCHACMICVMIAWKWQWERDVNNEKQGLSVELHWQQRAEFMQATLTETTRSSTRSRCVVDLASMTRSIMHSRIMETQSIVRHLPAHYRPAYVHGRDRRRAFCLRATCNLVWHTQHYQHLIRGIILSERTRACFPFLGCLAKEFFDASRL